ncbi:MAG: thiolase domain-containing protein [Anaerolineaceae bacterium]|nr:thiolase domain-containing protein [Anaerolineaceae bacterium]
MRQVSIVGIGQVPVQKVYSESLRWLGATAVRQAMAHAGVDQVDALFAGNMLSDELQNQKHLAALIADEAGLFGIEALQVRAATATGAAALRMAYLAVASGEAELAVAVGAEKMSEGAATPALAKALDTKQEVAAGATLISKNAELMQLYMEKHGMPEDGLVNFAINAHQNALTNPHALFHKPISAEDVLQSRFIVPPIRLLDCSPICDGAAAVVLAPSQAARAYTDTPVHILASSVATDRFRMADRSNPLALEAAALSAQKAFQRANITAEDVSLYEVHDAFSIMACLLLEAAGFAAPGYGWRLAADGEIVLQGKVPIATMGGLKARGHPIGATALYQTAEIVQQLTGQAGPNQVPNAQVGLLQSVGGAAATVLTHVFGV